MRLGIKYLTFTLLVGVVLLNLIAVFHSYKFTHFNVENKAKTDNPERLSVFGKLKTLCLGVNLPRPANKNIPTRVYETVFLESNKQIECWHIKNERSKGVVVLFHGYGGEKSSLLDKSEEFIKLGYTTFLVDFMGSGGSEGNQTTIGFFEAEQVKSVFDYLKSEGNENIILYGTSMGAVSILKAINDYAINPNSIILECPFGEMYKTVCSRFEMMGVPVFPMAGLLTFWGGIQNGFWAFGHRPIEYAKTVECPVLLMYGEKDPKVSKEEIELIKGNLSGEVVYKNFEFAGHENYLNKFSDEWRGSVIDFLEKCASTK